MNIENLGKPVTILKYNKADKSFHDESNILKELFLHEKVKDKKVVVFSIVGSFRRGKSFFLDYCLRYLYANYDSLNRKDTEFKKDFNWMGHQNEKLSGFSWRSGAERDTTGIIFWSDVFFHTNNLNEKFAIFVVDTQGLFDNETTLMENSQIFALSSLISSIQVINLNGNIREDELDSFQFAIEFGKLTKKDGIDSKEFQKLVLLVRDWQNPDDYEFGEIGGTKYLNHVLKLKENKNEKLNSVYEFVLKSCEQLGCHLLPHPGKSVAGRKGYNGQWALMDEDFRFELFDSIERLLNSYNLVVKKACGRQISSENFFVHLQTYFKHFASNDIPKVASMYNMLVEKDLDFLVAKAFRTFEETLEYFENKADSEVQIEETYRNSKELAIYNFQNEPKLGDDNSIKNAENNLKDMILSYYKKWKTTQLTFLCGKKIIKNYNFQVKMMADTIENAYSINKYMNKKITKLNKKLKAESQNKARIFESYNEKLEIVKQEYNASIENEKLKFESALIQTKNQNVELMSKIDELNNSIKEFNSRMNSYSSKVNCPKPVQSSKSLNDNGSSSGSSPLEDYFSQLTASKNALKSSSYDTSSVPASTTRCANPWNQFQREFSPIWRAMSETEKQEAGGYFQRACSNAYWASKNNKS